MHKCAIVNISTMQKGEMKMKFFELPLVIDNEEQERRLEALARRYTNINGWSEQDILTFAIGAYSPLIDMLIITMEIKAEQIETEKEKGR